jgi:hypothetical protein
VHGWLGKNALKQRACQRDRVEGALPPPGQYANRRSAGQVVPPSSFVRGWVDRHPKNEVRNRWTPAFSGYHLGQWSGPF